MKKSELIKLLEQVPDDAEIAVNSDSNCDILGDYRFNPNLIIEKVQCGADFSKMYSNYNNTSETITVWVIL